VKCAEVLRVNLLALMHQNHKLWDIAECVIQNSDLIIHISEIQTMTFSVLENVLILFMALPRKNGKEIKPMTKITEPTNSPEMQETTVLASLNEVAETESESSLIQVKQIPVIIENLKSVKSVIEKKVNSACEMVCTDENYKEIKKLRSELNKEFSEFESRRKAVKSEIITPYEAFETVYKDCVLLPYKKADSALKGKVDTIEQGLKQEKYEKSKSYFDEYSKSLGIDFVAYEQVSLNITMSVSLKKLKETIKSNLDKIMDDLKLIATQEHKDEILYEYKRSLNVSVAITSVTERYKAIEEEKARAEAERAEREKAEQAVSNTLDEYEPFVANVPEEVAPPVEEISEQPQQDEKVLSLSFKVYGTKSQLKDFALTVKQLINERGLRYE
jgi:hypothetical protein